MIMEVIKKSLISPVTALCAVQDFVLVGNGSQVSIYHITSAKHVQTIDALLDHRVHGIRRGISGVCGSSGNQWPIVVFGQRSWRVLTLTIPPCESDGECHLRLLTCLLYCNDWILDVLWLGSDASKLVIGTAHNTVEVWEQAANCPGQYSCVRQSQCEVFCILYSCLLSGTSEDDLVVYAGTVFNKVLIWYPFADSTADGLGKVNASLDGHEGVIFSIVLDASGTMACTVSDDRTVRTWQLSRTGSQLCAKCMQVMYGHTARVWKAVFVSNFIVSIGEDAVVCVWDSTGRLVKDIKGHQGLNVWSVCAADSPTPSIVTGGGDAGVRWWSLADLDGDGPVQHSVAVPDVLQQMLASSASSKSSDFVRDVAVANQNQLLFLMNSGCLLLYETITRSLQVVLHEPAFASYSVLSLDAPSGYVALGSLRGHINVVKWDGSGQSGCLLAHAGKVFSVTWAQATSAHTDGRRDLFTIGPDGCMKWWKVGTSSPPAMSELSCVAHAQFSLPPCKHRWLSAVTLAPACDLKDSDSVAAENTALTRSAVFVVVGDRKGSLHTFKHADESSGAITDPLCTLPGIHGKNGVNDVVFRHGIIQSCGRDGHLRCFRLSSNGTLEKLSDRKFLAGVDWLEKIIPLGDNRDVLVGFHATSLKVWDMARAEVLVTVPCGGGHRSWHHSVSQNREHVTFAFVQAGRVHYCSAEISEWSRQRILQGSFHGREITCLAQLRTDLSERTVIASGSEDCSIRLSYYNPAVGGFQTLQHQLCTHISGVRALASATTTDGRCILVSGGGRSQMKAWSVSCTNASSSIPAPSCVTVAETTPSSVTAAAESRSSCSVQQLCQYPPPLSQRDRRLQRQQPPTDVSAESRVMSLSVVSVCTAADVLGVHLDGRLQGLFVWAAYSDGWLRLFLIDLTDGGQPCFQLLAESEQQSRSLLCSELVLLPAMSSVAMVTAGGSGEVAVWDCSQLLKKVLSRHVHGALDGGGIGLLQVNPVKSFLSHQCTVTCLTVEIALDGCGVRIFSGGDDGSLVVRCVSGFVDDDVLSLHERTLAYRSDCHGSTVTGICRLQEEDVIASTSCDQHVSIWRICRDTPGSALPSSPPSYNRKEAFAPLRGDGCQQDFLAAVSTSISDVADCHALLGWKKGLSASLLILGGAGLQCLRVDNQQRKTPT